jgi:hypothetical protein
VAVRSQGPYKSRYIAALTKLSETPETLKCAARRFAMLLSEEQDRKVLPMGWSAEEELIIKTIQQTELVPRAEALRRMRRRKKASNLAQDRAWYAARLDDPWLLDFSIVVRRSDRHFLLAVPTGGRRRGGFVSLESPEDAD